MAIDVTAAYATAPLVPKYAGNAARNASTAIAIAAKYGTRSAFRRRHNWWPGTARSRENAYIIRDADVIEDIPQYNCAPTVMNNITFAVVLPSASRYTCLTANVPAAPVVLKSWIAKVTPRARM